MNESISCLKLIMLPVTIKKYQMMMDDTTFDQENGIMILYKTIENIYRCFFTTGKDLVLAADGTIALRYQLNGQMGSVQIYQKLKLKQTETIIDNLAEKQFINKFQAFRNHHYRSAPKSRQMLSSTSKFACNFVKSSESIMAKQTSSTLGLGGFSSKERNDLNFTNII